MHQNHKMQRREGGEKMKSQEVWEVICNELCISEFFACFWKASDYQDSLVDQGYVVILRNHNF